MGDYQDALLEHLADYADKVVKPTGRGEYRGRVYDHILPPSESDSNLLEPFRETIIAYLAERPRVKRHKYFHHLNSSQAFAFNLFLPYFFYPRAAPMLADALGEEGEIRNADFEVVLDRKERTNIDVSWQRGSIDANGEWTHCEVKLSESGFGTAKPDQEHQDKLADTYRPRLKDIVGPAMLEEKSFFRHYQILRNIALLHNREKDRVLFLFPKRNVALERELDAVLPHVAKQYKDRIRVRYVEDVLMALRDDSRADDRYRSYAAALCEKYLPA